MADADARTAAEWTRSIRSHPGALIVPPSRVGTTAQRARQCERAREGGRQSFNINIKLPHCSPKRHFRSHPHRIVLPYDVAHLTFPDQPNNWYPLPILSHMEYDSIACRIRRHTRHACNVSECLCVFVRYL